MRDLLTERGRGIVRASKLSAKIVWVGPEIGEGRIAAPCVNGSSAHSML